MKDIDKLQKRNRTYRDLTERLGSTDWLYLVLSVYYFLECWSGKCRADIH